MPRAASSANNFVGAAWRRLPNGNRPLPLLFSCGSDADYAECRAAIAPHLSVVYASVATTNSVWPLTWQHPHRRRLHDDHRSHSVGCQQKLARARVEIQTIASLAISYIRGAQFLEVRRRPSQCGTKVQTLVLRVVVHQRANRP